MRKFAVGCVVLTAVMAGACKGGTVKGGEAGSNSNVVTDGSIVTAVPGSEPKSTATDGEVEITGKGFTQLPANSIGDSYVSYAVTVSNSNSAAASKPLVADGVRLNITFRGADGNVVKSESETINFILPGKTMAIGTSTEAAGVATMEVKALVDRWTPNESPITGAFTTSEVTTRPDDYGGVKTSGSVASTFAKDYKDVIGVAVYRNAAGDILGGDYSFIDFVQGGGTVSFEVSGSNSPGRVARTDVYFGLSNLSLLS